MNEWIKQYSPNFNIARPGSESILSNTGHLASCGSQAGGQNKRITFFPLLQTLCMTKVRKTTLFGGIHEAGVVSAPKLQKEHTVDGAVWETPPPLCLHHCFFPQEVSRDEG